MVLIHYFFFYYFHFLISAVAIFLQLQVDRDWMPSSRDRFLAAKFKVKEKSQQMFDKSFGRKIVASSTVCNYLMPAQQFLSLA